MAGGAGHDKTRTTNMSTRSGGTAGMKTKEQATLNFMKEKGSGDNSSIKQLNEKMSSMIRMCNKMMEKIDRREEEWTVEKNLWIKERQQWAEEKKDLEERVSKLEWEGEKREREKRRQNVVIKGANIERDNQERKVEDFIKQNLKVEVRVEKAYEIKIKREGREDELVIAKLADREMKEKVMTNKRNLERGIYIENDLTGREREIQRMILNKAKVERSKGKITKVGYMKIMIDNKWIKYNEWSGEFREENRFTQKE